MLLNSNSYNSNFLLIRTFFSVLWPKNALANLNFRIFKNNEDKYLFFTLIVVKYLLVYRQILLLQKTEVCRESVVLLHCLNLLFFLLLKPDWSFHCWHVENTKRFWRTVQTFLLKDFQPHHHIFKLRLSICHTRSLVLVKLSEFFHFWESTLSCKHDNLLYEFSDCIPWPKILQFYLVATEINEKVEWMGHCLKSGSEGWLEKLLLKEEMLLLW